MAIRMNDVFRRATDYSGSPSRKIGKGILGMAIVILLGAFGLELGNTDFDLNALLSGAGASNSKIERDANGNLQRDLNGNFVTRVLRDKEGNAVAAGARDAKYTDEYNCSDFRTQPEAQAFFIKAGGKQKDTNRLDGDGDGIACEDLPVK